MSALDISRMVIWKISCILASTYLDTSCSDTDRSNCPGCAGKSISNFGDDMDDLAEVYLILIFSASSVPIWSITAISLVMLVAPIGSTAECRMAPP